MDAHLLRINFSHPIQVTILDRLRHERHLEYSQIIPDGYSGNEFLYHLRKLLEEKVVIKTESTYSLSPLGLLLADTASYDSNKLKLRPTVGAWLHVTGQDGMILLYDSYRAPFFGQTCLPYGKLRLGETMDQTFQRLIRKRHIDRWVLPSWEPITEAYDIRRTENW
jgi:hypothetical protein